VALTQWQRPLNRSESYDYPARPAPSRSDPDGPTCLSLLQSDFSTCPRSCQSCMTTHPEPLRINPSRLSSCRPPSFAPAPARHALPRRINRTPPRPPIPTQLQSRLSPLRADFPSRARPISPDPSIRLPPPSRALFSPRANPTRLPTPSPAIAAQLDTSAQIPSSHSDVPPPGLLRPIQTDFPCLFSPYLVPRPFMTNRTTAPRSDSSLHTQSARSRSDSSLLPSHFCPLRSPAPWSSCFDPLDKPDRRQNNPILPERQIRQRKEGSK
jgi:hypothetical protein